MTAIVFCNRYLIGNHVGQQASELRQFLSHSRGEVLNALKFVDIRSRRAVQDWVPIVQPSMQVMDLNVSFEIWLLAVLGMS